MLCYDLNGSVDMVPPELWHFFAGLNGMGGQGVAIYGKFPEKYLC